jgi:4-amino-4-deoxy-L-arabinose transferase-like glycosyltransferase
VSPPGERKERPSLSAHAWWLTTGALTGLGVVSILTIGIFLLPAGIALGVVGAVSPRFRNRSALTILAGFALPMLYLAWLNRSGPGEVCNSASTSCVEEWSPWPFAVIALLLLAAPVCVTRSLRS